MGRARQGDPIADDLVAYRLRLKRCRHGAAQNDTAVFQLTLRGYNYTGVAAGQAFVAEYVARQEARYREDWRSAARVLWGQRTCGGEAERDVGGVAVAAD